MGRRGEGQEGGTARWSPDGRRVAFLGTHDGESGVLIADADGSDVRLLAATSATNHPLPRQGEELAWSPDGARLAFVAAKPGPEPEMEADPIVITRYLYRPAKGHPERFNDNRRLHLFVADVANGDVTQLTEGRYYEHSIAWSPDGRRLLFLSNHEPDPDFFFNYDLFTIDVDTKDVQQLTETRSNEFTPVWSPDGKSIAYSGVERLITSSETGRDRRTGQPTGSGFISRCSRAAASACIGCRQQAAIRSGSVPPKPSAGVSAILP